MPDAHNSAKSVLDGALALKLTVHDNIDVLGSLDALSIDKLTRLELVHQGIVHEVLEGLKGHL